eukprot:gene11170-5927_t
MGLFSNRWYYAASGSKDNPGELGQYTVAELSAEGGRLRYAPVAQTAAASVASRGWSFVAIEDPDLAHVCSYCNYDTRSSCPAGPS